MNFDPSLFFLYNEYMDFKRAPWEKILVVIIELFLIINIVVIDVVIFQSLKHQQQPQAAIIKQEVPDKTTITSPLSSPSANPASTSNAILVTPTPIVIYQSASPAVKEYFVPFGSGQSTASTWTDVTGLQAYVDSGSYPNIKQVVFEASVYVPTGNQTASVQLFNKTAGHPVWFSQVSMSGGTPQFLVSQPITLDPGNNLYQVQMQTQLQYQAILNQARIHIYLK